MEVLLMILTGLVSGIIGGMGMGGGTILIPFLNILFSVNQHTAQAVNLAAFIPMSIIALVIHIKNKLINYKKAVFVIIPACITAVGGAFAAKNIDSISLQKFFGVFLILLALFQIVIYIIEKKKSKKTNEQNIQKE